MFHSSAWTEENFDRCTRPEVEGPLFHRKYEFLTDGGNNGEGKVEGLTVGPWDNFLISTFQGGVPHQIVQPRENIRSNSEMINNRMSTWFELIEVAGSN